mmetsp:Transcript_149301/g.260764  ORF Transcript_149301/g.260764 Transcript_149301/m.260764 type:complete len:99 (-) Transcript_149301:473-769(-)
MPHSMASISPWMKDSTGAQHACPPTDRGCPGHSINQSGPSPVDCAVQTASLSSTTEMQDVQSGSMDSATVSTVNIYQMPHETAHTKVRQSRGSQCTGW